VSDVRKWLQAIGLAQYGDILESHDLDIDLLRQVDGRILKDTDVSGAGGRLRIRNAIAKLKSKATLDMPENAAGGSKMKDLLDLPPGIC
jgi:hypothetical protein